MTTAEIWARCRVLEERLRARLPAWQPFPGWFEMRGVGRAVGGLKDERTPPPAAVRRVLEALLAAADVMDFEAQAEITGLLGELEGEGAAESPLRPVASSSPRTARGGAAGAEANGWRGRSRP